MKKTRIHKLFRKARKRVSMMNTTGVFGVVAMLMVFGSVLVVNQARATLVQLDGGGGGSFDGVRTRDLPADTAPSTATTSVTSQYTNANGSAQGRYVWTTNPQVTLWYAWNRGTLPSSDSSTKGWATALADPSISIGYDYSIYDAANPTQVIEPGSTVPSGKQVILKFEKYTSDNIFWFGTGSSMDSPYGEWRANAGPPSRSGNNVTCVDKDLVQEYTYRGNANTYVYDVYIPFVASPPTRSLGTLTGLSCGSLTTNSDGSASATCTVTAASGSVSPTFNYAATSGKFYYRYYDRRDMTSIGWGGPGCYGNNIPLTSSFGTASGPFANTTTSLQSAYVVSIPAQSRPYTLNITSGNNPPAKPTLTCTPNPTTPGTNVSVKLTATDPDGDNVRYSADWSGDGVMDSGWTGYVTSGTSQTLTKTGGYTAGTYTVTGWAQDAGGAQSAAATCTFTITAANQPNLTASAVSPVTATVDTPVTLRSTITNSGTATPTGFSNFFQSATDNTGTNATYIDTDTSPIVAGGGTDITTISTTFTSPGSWYVRACADKASASDPDQVVESNENDNCGAWTKVTVSNPATAFTCTVDDDTPALGQTVTYTANGGDPSDTYSWQAADGWSGTQGVRTPTISRTFNTAGTYGMQVTDQTGANKNATCSSVVVGSACSNPTVSITATPGRVRQGDTTSISWTASGVTSCTITGTDGFSTLVTANSCNVPLDSTTRTINAQAVYTITCGSVTDQVVVNVIPNFQEF